MKKILCLPWKFSSKMFQGEDSLAETWLLDDLNGNIVGYVYFDNESKDYFYRGATKDASIHGHTNDPVQAKATIERCIGVKIVNDRLKTLM